MPSLSHKNKKTNAAFQWLENDGTWKSYPPSISSKLQSLGPSQSLTFSPAANNCTYTISITNAQKEGEGTQENNSTKVQRKVRKYTQGSGASQYSDSNSVAAVPSVTFQFLENDGSFQNITENTIIQTLAALSVGAKVKDHNPPSLSPTLIRRGTAL